MKGLAMRVFKSISFIVLLAILIPILVSAQPATKVPKGDMMPPPEKARMLTEKMKTVLTLNDDQFSKAMKINLDFFTAMDALKRAMIDTGKDEDESKKEMKKIRSEQMKQLKLIFTGEQWKLFKENKKEFERMFKKK